MIDYYKNIYILTKRTKVFINHKITVDSIYGDKLLCCGSALVRNFI